MSTLFARALIVFTAIVASVSIAAPVAAASEGEGRYIVVFNESVEHPGDLAHDQVDATEGDMTAFFSRVLDGYAATLPTDQVDDIRRDPEVDYVTIDHQVGLLEEEVNLETINNGGVEILEATIPTGIQRTYASANKALSIDGIDNLRADVDVAVIDTGIDYEHPDLSVAGRTSCTSGTCIDNSGKDGHSHGTHVAGTIGAIDNGSGVAGVASGARMWGVKVLSDAGSGQESWIIKGVEWVTAHASTIEVANMSLGCGCSMPALDTAINKSIEAGVVYSVAAGNSNSNASSFSPASNPNVITVSAVADYDGKPGAKAAFTCENYGLDDRKASFSNYGTGVDVAAPGVCTVSTTPGNTYGTKSGTSMASPHVAGAAAILAIQKNPGSKADVEGIRNTIVAAGNSEWTDTSPDGVKEPLLDLSNESTFSLTVKPPENTALPVASPATPLQAVPETTTTGTWTGSPTSYAYQWERCNAAGGECVDIAGATKATYTPVGKDVEKTLVVKVTATNSGGSNSARSNATNKVVKTGQITEYTLPEGVSGYRITSGKKYLWFSGYTKEKLYRLSVAGVINAERSKLGAGLCGIAIGPKGNIWYTKPNLDEVGYTLESSSSNANWFLPAGSGPREIAEGPEENMWFTNNSSSKIGKITPTGGIITEYALPIGSGPEGITKGPDGNLWFTEWSPSGKIGKITPSGTITEYALPTESYPAGITAGPDGNVWYVNTESSKVGKITPSGIITEYALPKGSGPTDIAAGADGNLWFTNRFSQKLGRITTSGTVTEYVIPAGSNPAGITAGPDGYMWYTELGSNTIGKIAP